MGQARSSEVGIIPPAATIRTIGVGLALVACAMDPLARGADPKRVTLLVAGFAFLVWTASRGRSLAREGPDATPAPIVAGSVFLAASLVSWMWGEPRGFETASTLLAGALLVLAARGLAGDERVHLARIAATATGALAGAVATVELVVRGRAMVHGGQGNPDWLGLLLAVVLPITAEHAAITRSREKVLLISAAAFEALVLLLSESRSGWIAAAVALAVVAWGRLARAATLTGVSASGLVLLASRTAEAAGPPGFHDKDAALALAGRLYLARQSAGIVLGTSPFGVGLGGFHRAFLAEQGRSLAKLPPEAAERAFLNADHAHSDWLEVAAESGILALASLAIAVVLGVRSLARARFFGGAGALAAFAVLALVDSPLRQPAVVAMLALVIACCPAGAPSTIGPPRWLVLVVAAGLGAWCTSLSARAWWATRLVTQAESAPLDARRAVLARAERIDPGTGEAALARGLFDLADGRWDGAEEALTRSAARLPGVGTLIAIGNARMGSGRIRPAIASYEAALALHPGSLRAHTNLGEALLATGDLERAGEHERIARRLSPGHPKVVELSERLKARAYARQVGE